MRRLNLALVALVIPAATLAAQVMIPTRGRRPDRPAEKPPQAPGIHDARLYNRYMLSRFSFESSPMLSFMSSAQVLAPGIEDNYWGFGEASMISWRAAPSLAVTTAFSAASLGMPMGVNSSELGVRVKPWTAPRISAFADARWAYTYITGFGVSSQAVPILALYPGFRESLAWGSGNGPTLGIGADARLNERFSLTTSLNYAHMSMHGRNLDTRREWDYTSQMTRLFVGLRYNHGHWYDAP